MAHLTTHSETDSIKRKSIQGVIALTSRTFALQIIAFVATFLLTIYLSPQIFGVFYIVSAFISFLSYFSDIGLAAALIQKKEVLTQEDLTTTFTIQQILIFFIASIALILSSSIGRFYHLDDAGIWLFRSLIVSFILSSLKTIPSVLLERDLAFHKLVIPQLLETLGFYVVAVLMAMKGFGVLSFTYAVLVRGIVGLIGIYIISPWRITFGISMPVAKRLMRFGIPFQLNSFLALLKDDLLTIVLGKILPLAEIGYIGWAKKWAEVPLRLVMDSVIRVTFPMYSRLQHAKETLASAVNNTLFALAAILFPISTGLLFFVEPALSLIPKYAKWEPAIPSFYFFVVTAAVAAISTVLTNTLNAVGNIRITLVLMIVWTVLGWLLTLSLVSIVGFIGVSIALFIISWTIVLVVYLVRKHIDIHVMSNIRVPILGVIVQSFWYYLSIGDGPFSWLRLSISALSGVILYGGIVYLIERKRILGLLSLRKGH